MITTSEKKIHISARVKEYVIPPLKDMLILGKNAPIGCIAMRRAIELLIKTPFEHLEIDDEIISDVLVRQQLLRRIPQEALLEFVLAHIKPLMAADEVLHAEVDVDVFLSSGK